MELWIRSQDKKELIKVDNIRIKHEYEPKKVNDNYGRTTAYINGEYRKSFIYTDSTWLGEYEKKERALEILDEIESIMQTNCCFELYSRTGKYPDEFNKKWNCVPVYQMPQE